MTIRWMPLLPLLLAGCSGAATGPADPEPVALVKVEKASSGAAEAMITVYGAADAATSEQRVLSAPVEAAIASIDAPVGSAVKPGQIVAHLRPSPTAEVDFTRAMADARTADAAYARAKRLRTDGLVSDAEVETARAASVSAMAMKTSLDRRSHALIMTAPVAGTVQAIGGGVGDIVPAGTAVAKIAPTGALRARFGIDPAMARRVPVGGPIRVKMSGSGSSFAAVVASVDPVVDPQTRLASVYARVPPGARIGGGEPLSGDVRLLAEGVAVSIPYAALLDDAGQPYLFVVANGVAHRRDVVVGPVTGARAAITKGVKSGETVVTDGGTAIEDGMKVRTR